MIRRCNNLLCYCGFCCIAFCCSITVDHVSFVFPSLLLWSLFLRINKLLFHSWYLWCFFVCHFQMSTSDFFFLHPSSTSVFRALFCFCVIADVTFVSDYCDRIRNGWRRSSICLRPTRNSARRYIAHSFFRASLFCYAEIVNTVGDGAKSFVQKSTFRYEVLASGSR